MIRDGVAFAVIAGTQQATAIFPADGSLAVADPQTRESAKRAVASLRPGGGTAIGQWLWLAHQMFTSHPAQLRHAILLTDGKDEHESAEDLGTAHQPVRGGFQLRLPRRRHRLGGGRAPPDLHRAARHASTSCPTRPGSPPTSRT